MKFVQHGNKRASHFLYQMPKHDNAFEKTTNAFVRARPAYSLAELHLYIILLVMRNLNDLVSRGQGMQWEKKVILSRLLMVRATVGLLATFGRFGSVAGTSSLGSQTLSPRVGLRIHGGTNPPTGLFHDAQSLPVKRLLETLATRRGRPFRISIAIMPTTGP